LEASSGAKKHIYNPPPSNTTSSGFPLFNDQITGLSLHGRQNIQETP
jgi:hypothetical protein